MRAEVLLRVNGTSRVVSIPRPILTYLGWLTGDKLVVELTDDNAGIYVRQMRPSDVPVRGRGHMTYDFTQPHKP